jgi:hypothetical protein
VDRVHDGDTGEARRAGQELTEARARHAPANQAVRTNLQESGVRGGVRDRLVAWVSVVDRLSDHAQELGPCVRGERERARVTVGGVTHLHALVAGDFDALAAVVV